eukprot:TRINITY_DN1790_c0_g1_i2.p1 TRINITY_DN1790_c0_g1~~TRINITY_DN1790_c0_g1_i2.p1  ORF type:complete len:110 (+),score=23.43 TRINITY_DN1790_c0_g1_i2:48-377(+)
MTEVSGRSVGVVSAAEQPRLSGEAAPATQDVAMAGMADAWSENSVGVRSTVSEVAQYSKTQKSNQTAYLCAECMEETRLLPTDPVRCQACGNRILYKRRGDCPVQYEAR